MAKKLHPTLMLVVVSGEDFPVPIDTPVDAIRAQLAQTFPEVTSATVKEGTKEKDGERYKTIEFVKKAGTKGATDEGNDDLVALLATVPADWSVTKLRGVPNRGMLPAMLAGRLTIGESIGFGLTKALEDVIYDRATIRDEGVKLCADFDHLPAAAGELPAGW